MDDTTKWDRARTVVERQVELANEALGLADADHSHKITFGYIGNGRFTSNGWNLDDTLWSVYLPHPGRVGTYQDRIGDVSYGDADGLARVASILVGFRQGAAFARNVTPTPECQCMARYLRNGFHTKGCPMV